MLVNHVVPVTVEVGAFNLESAEVGVGYLDTGEVGVGVELAADLQAGCGGGVGDEIDDDLMACQRSAAPVLGDVRKEPVFNLVPLAGARREVADADAQPGLIGQLLQLGLPKSAPGVVVAACVGGDQ